MASDADGGQDSVILAGFESRRVAEHMVTSLGRGFRKTHRKGRATAVVISPNKDGSLKVTQSRVLSASGVVYTVMRVSASVAVGFAGILSSLSGGRGAVRDVRERGSHVGSDEQRAHEILARFGPNAALLLVACDDEDPRPAVVSKAADLADESWDGSRARFLAGLDPGSQNDWVRAALGESSIANG